MDDTVKAKPRPFLTTDEYQRARGLVTQRRPTTLVDLGIRAKGQLPWSNPHQAPGTTVPLRPEVLTSFEEEARCQTSGYLIQFLTNPVPEFSSKTFSFNGRYVTAWNELELRVKRYEADPPVPPDPNPLDEPADNSPKNRVLIIHGHDEANRKTLKDLLKALGLPEPLVMKEISIPGATMPEKLEKIADRVEFVVALLTPDDLGRDQTTKKLQPRARQNVVLEIGWFWGRLGRKRVLLLVKQNVEWPSDLQGIEFHNFENTVEDVAADVRAFFKAHNCLNDT